MIARTYKITTEESIERFGGLLETLKFIFGDRVIVTMSDRMKVTANFTFTYAKNEAVTCTESVYLRDVIDAGGHYAETLAESVIAQIGVILLTPHGFIP